MPDIKQNPQAGMTQGQPLPGFVIEEDQPKPRKQKKLPEKTGGLTINSLMDILTILMIFFLKNYAADPVNITPGEDLQLSQSNSKLKPEDAVPIAITTRAILVNDEPIAAVVDGKVDPSIKRGGATGYLINPLYDALEAERRKQETIARYNPQQTFKGLATIIGDKGTQFRLLTEVMYTAGQAQFANFKFAAIQGE